MPVADRLADLSRASNGLEVVTVEVNGEVFDVEVPRGASDDQVMRAVRKLTSEGLTGTVTDDKPWPEQLGDSTLNTVAGAVEGIGAIPDAVTEAIAGGMRYVARPMAKASETLYGSLGMDDAAARVRRNAATIDRGLSSPATFRKGAEKIAPVPKDFTGQAVRLGAGMMGGAATPQAILPKFLKTQPKAPRLPKSTESGKLVAAGKRQNIPVRRPDANPALRGKATAIEATPYGNPRMNAAYADDVAQIQQRAQSLSPGQASDEAYNLGGKIQKAGRDYITNTGKQFGKLYDQVDELSQNIKVNPKEAIKAVDDQIAELVESGANTNAVQISYLRGLREDLAKPGGFTMKQFQALRSANKGVIRGDSNLASSDATRRLDNVVRAFSDDASAQLPDEAVALLRETDQAYAQRQDFITNVLQKHVLGRRNNQINPERAASNFERLSKGDYDAVSRLWDVLPKSLQDEVSATRVAQIGVNPGGEFQAGRFASDVNKFPANIRQVMYGEEGAASLDDLASIARAKSQTMGKFNPSRSSVPLMHDLGRRLTQSGGAGLGVGVATGNPLAGVMTTAGLEGARAANQIRAAKGLLAPAKEATAPLVDEGTARAVALMTNPAAQQRMSGLLGEFLDAGTVARLAAEEREEDERRRRGLLVAPAGY